MYNPGMPKGVRVRSVGLIGLVSPLLAALIACGSLAGVPASTPSPLPPTALATLTPAPTFTPSPSPEPTSATSAGTYTNDQLGFEITFPSGATFNELQPLSNLPGLPSAEVSVGFLIGSDGDISILGFSTPGLAGLPMDQIVKAYSRDQATQGDRTLSFDRFPNPQGTELGMLTVAVDSSTQRTYIFFVNRKTLIYFVFDYPPSSMQTSVQTISEITDTIKLH
jgi:hypothetical protein